MAAEVKPQDQSVVPHIVAVTLVCATFPLIWVGGLVTSYDAGMAVPDWPTTYGYNMFLYPMSTWLTGPWDLFIEHGHRLLGSLAGILTIALNVAIWKYDSRRWMRWVGAAAFLLVVSQGLLGGMRVRMNSTDFARAHGCTGPLFFAFSVSICVMTSRFWRNLNTPQGSASIGVARGSVVGGWLLVGLAYMQLVLGAHLRHPGLTWSPSQFKSIVLFHVILAVILVIHSFNTARMTKGLAASLRRPAFFAVALIACQFLLGVATWRAKYGWPSFVPMVSEAQANNSFAISIYNTFVGRTVLSESMTQALTVTGHVALGSLILATSVMYATRVSRMYAASSCRRENSVSSTTKLIINQNAAKAVGGVVA